MRLLTIQTSRRGSGIRIPLWLYRRSHNAAFDPHCVGSTLDRHSVQGGFGLVASRLRPSLPALVREPNGGGGCWPLGSAEHEPHAGVRPCPCPGCRASTPAANLRRPPAHALWSGGHHRRRRRGRDRRPSASPICRAARVARRVLVAVHAMGLTPRQLLTIRNLPPYGVQSSCSVAGYTYH